MTKIHKLTADNMTRCWLNVPAVTQFDEADITDLEEFRKSMKAEAEKERCEIDSITLLSKGRGLRVDRAPAGECVNRSVY